MARERAVMARVVPASRWRGNPPGVVAVRDGEDPNGLALDFAPKKWSAFPGGELCVP
ncbi:DUF397 domain-containing protein [Streptosporangium sp. NPDC049078]|uniref:DUF397 domain-containing protein n=1 Tax=Streptosporangium sp. NPDC049078 TaxID=3155767 RepID=UPI00343248DA